MQGIDPSLKLPNREIISLALLTSSVPPSSINALLGGTVSTVQSETRFSMACKRFTFAVFMSWHLMLQMAEDICAGCIS